MLNFLKSLFNQKSSNPSSSTSSHKKSRTNTSYEQQEGLPARRLLKEATQLKKEKNYNAACRKLEEAFSANGSEGLMLKERMRLPMYLQLAGKNDQAWEIFNEMRTSYTDVFSQAELANQMRVFLQKEKKFHHALIFEAWVICKELVRDRQNIIGIHENADMCAKEGIDLSFGRRDIIKYTEKNNPIYDAALLMFEERIDDAVSPSGVEKRIRGLVKKSGMQIDSITVANELSGYLSSHNDYQLHDIRDIINKIT